MISLFEMTPGARLVLSCARWLCDTDSLDTLRHHASEIRDWREVLNVADAHAQTPTTAWCLKTQCRDLTPADIVAELQITLRHYAAAERVLALGLWRVNRTNGVEYPRRVTEFVNHVMRDQSYAERMANHVMIGSPDR